MQSVTERGLGGGKAPCAPSASSGSRHSLAHPPPSSLERVQLSLVRPDAPQPMITPRGAIHRRTGCWGSLATATTTLLTGATGHLYR